MGKAPSRVETHLFIGELRKELVAVLNHRLGEGGPFWHDCQASHQSIDFSNTRFFATYKEGVLLLHALNQGIGTKHEIRGERKHPPQALMLLRKVLRQGEKFLRYILILDWLVNFDFFLRPAQLGGGRHI